MSDGDTDPEAVPAPPGAPHQVGAVEVATRRGRAARERVFLEGPTKRRWELRAVVRIGREYLRGLRALHFVGPCVTVFGSARVHPAQEEYALAVEVGRHLAQSGFTVMTGGGPGVMEAANRGAKEAGGVSVGCNIRLPHEQSHNAYLDRVVTFDHFFVRKVMLVKYSFGFVVMPGGFGTFDELFEAATLVQTGKIAGFPMVLVGRHFWEPLLSSWRSTLLANGYVDAIDLTRFLVTDDPAEAAEHIVAVSTRKFGLRAGRRRLPAGHWWLGERGTPHVPTDPIRRNP